MAENRIAPTKGNLINVKKSLGLAKVGYDLLDRKRNILIREMMTMIDKASSIQGEIDLNYAEAYAALQMANIVLGFCDEAAKTVPPDDGLDIDFRSVMGVEIPIVTLEERKIEVPFGLNSSTGMLDKAYLKFENVKRLTARLAEIENSIYRLADAIKKTQKRANALKNVMIPQFADTVKTISDALDEKDREEFSRLKVIKAQKNNK
ncbi:MAG: V-type ATP synthase subunit D [Oscillospiraceae bacterium]|jgi:V/A-type H+-transporting ATPase subunit D|nr:V-type ATP synthase subunit D [Oscillospiraceae bacterium]